jgi:hypothetical protein
MKKVDILLMMLGIILIKSDLDRSLIYTYLNSQKIISTDLDGFLYYILINGKIIGLLNECRDNVGIKTKKHQ